MSSILAIVGRGNSGKTTLLIKIVSELTKRNYRVATVKHTFHKINFDRPGTDSWKHIEAGSKATILSTPDLFFMIKPDPKTGDLNHVLAMLHDQYDLILIEGYKKSNVPKIEVYRSTAGPPLEGIKNIVAIATNEPLATKTRQFSLDDIGGITDFIVSNFIT
jgi:molybdopterin-guanine dinucleotide biosynthesis adapter protein